MVRLACLLGLSVARVSGQQATLLGDAHVSSARPDVNAGSLSNLDVGNGATALIQFDLGTLPSGATAAQVTRATLRLYCNRVDIPGTISVQAVNAAWSESTVTYSAFPALGAAVQSAQAGTAQQFVTFDVTSIVQQWISAPATNHGLALTSTSAVVQFDSKENDQTAHAPQLEIATTGGGSTGGSGANGATGATGPTGLTGATGSIGPAGLTGATGLTGASGSTGAAGVQGATGPTGAAGLPGATGTAGLQGSTGFMGPAGFTGSTGLIGPTGFTGSSGSAGLAGATGATGSPGLVYQGTYSSVTNYAAKDVVIFSGSSYVSLMDSNHGNTPGLVAEAWGPLAAQGSTGLTGATGSIGAVGPPGSPGSVGPPGEQGPQGAQGIAGQMGAQGTPGAMGATGLSGPMGPQGVPGPTGLNFQGNYSSTANYKLADGVFWQGAGWVSLIPNNQGNTPDQSPTAWAMFAAGGQIGVTGATGVTGPEGAAGVPGVAGSSGSTGATGAQGATGIPGLMYQGAYASASNYALGDVVLYVGSSYVSLMASNHGNTPDQSPTAWGLLAPQGSTGPAGPPGPIGATGTMGLVGTTGAQGSAGPTGPQGSQGAQGPAGAQGLTGATGAQGPAGPQGAQGVAGQAGAQGIAGAAGTTGPQGPAGVQGPQGATGPAGATGANGAAGMNFRGPWQHATNYGLNDSVTYDGSTYLAQSSNTNLEPDNFPETWTVLAQAGGAGPTGPAGQSAAITIGTVTTLAAGASATVTITGTPPSAVLNFGIPQGIAGAAGTSGGTSTVGGNAPTAMYHGVSFNQLYYAVGASTGDANENPDILSWVPLGCTATRLDVYSQQSGSITVTLRAGTPGSMADTTLACSPSTNASCSATGSVSIPAGNFIDVHIEHASGTIAGVWTAIQCQ